MLVRKRTLTLITAFAMLSIPWLAPEASALPHPDGDHYQYYFLSTDGITNLHADVLRPKGLPNHVRTPVILTVSPYTNHNGATTDTDLNGVGPSPRFYDFLNLSNAIRKGYTYAMVYRQGCPARQVLRRLDRAHGHRPAAAGVVRRGLSGTCLRRLPLHLDERHPPVEHGRHAHAVPSDRREARPSERRPRVSRQQRPQRVVLPDQHRRRGLRRQPQRSLLAGAESRPDRTWKDHPGFPDPRFPGDEHAAGWGVSVLERAIRRGEPGLVRAVRSLPRLGDGGRLYAHQQQSIGRGQGRIHHRGDELPRRAPEGDTAPGAAANHRRSGHSRSLPRRGGVAARRLAAV